MAPQDKGFIISRVKKKGVERLGQWGNRKEGGTGSPRLMLVSSLQVCCLILSSDSATELQRTLCQSGVGSANSGSVPV